MTATTMMSTLATWITRREPTPVICAEQARAV